MNGNDILNRMTEIGIVPAVVLNRLEDAEPLADALLAANQPNIEITMRTACAAEAIALLRNKRPEMLVGAGTVMILPGNDGLIKALDAGAQYIVSAGFDPEIVTRCVELDIPSVPACASGTEIQQALKCGTKTVKYYPAEALGGIELLKALAGPFRHTGIGFVPTNGITLDNLADYISLPYVRACGGPWFAPADLIEAGRLDEIKERNRKAVEVVKKIRSNAVA